MKKTRARGRPEKAIEADFGPLQAIISGKVVVGYRPDPEAPSAPAIRGASRKVIYHQLWLAGYLTDEHHEAADRYLQRLEVASGAKGDTRGNGASSYGPTQAQVAALADLREADGAIGVDALVKDVRQVIGWNLWPGGLAPADFRDALGRVAERWGM